MRATTSKAASERPAIGIVRVSNVRGRHVDGVSSASDSASRMRLAASRTGGEDSCRASMTQSNPAIEVFVGRHAQSQAVTCPRASCL